MELRSKLGRPRRATSTVICFVRRARPESETKKDRLATLAWLISTTSLSSAPRSLDFTDSLWRRRLVAFLTITRDGDTSSSEATAPLMASMADSSCSSVSGALKTIDNWKLTTFHSPDAAQRLSPQALNDVGASPGQSCFRPVGHSTRRDCGVQLPSHADHSATRHWHPETL